jgi:hypothetical protein
MKMKIFFIAFLSVSLFSCFEKEKKQVNTATDVSRDFIRATLDGNFKAAEVLLIKDTQTAEIFASYEDYYLKLSEEKKRGYKNSNIIINTFENINDSTAIIDYSNSFMNKAQKIKVVKKNNIWGVDFKYTSGDTTISK